MEIVKTVGIMFFKDKKLLVNKPRLRPTYQIVGGHIEKGESPIQAIIRECREELGDKALFDIDKIKYVMDFIEVNTAFPDKKIHMHLFIYEGILEGELSLSEEISLLSSLVTLSIDGLFIIFYCRLFLLYLLSHLIANY